MSKDVIKKKSIYFNEQLYNEILNGFVDENTQQQIKQNDDKKITVFTSSQKKRIQRVSDAFVQSKGIKNFLQQQIANKFEIFRKKRDENYKTSLMMAQLNQLLNQVQQKQQEEELEDQEEEKKKKKGGGFNILGTINKIQNVIDAIRLVKDLHKAYKKEKLKLKERTPKKHKFNEEDAGGVKNQYKIIAMGVVTGIYNASEAVLNSEYVKAFNQNIKRIIKRKVSIWAAKLAIRFSLGKLSKGIDALRKSGKLLKKGKAYDTTAEVIQKGADIARKHDKLIVGTISVANVMYEISQLFDFDQEDVKAWDNFVDTELKPYFQKLGKDVTQGIKKIQKSKTVKNLKENGISFKNLEIPKKKNNTSENSSDDYDEIQSATDKKNNHKQFPVNLYLPPISNQQVQKLKDKSQETFKLNLTDKSFVMIYNSLPVEVVRKMTYFIDLVNEKYIESIKELLKKDDLGGLMKSVSVDVMKKLPNGGKLFGGKIKTQFKNQFLSDVSLVYLDNSEIHLPTLTEEKPPQENVQSDNDTFSNKHDTHVSGGTKKNFQWGIGGVELLTKNVYGYFDGVVLNIKNKKPIKILFEKNKILNVVSAHNNKDGRTNFRSSSMMEKTQNDSVQFYTYEKYNNYKNLIKTLNSYLQAADAEMQYQMKFSEIIKQFVKSIIRV